MTYREMLLIAAAQTPVSAPEVAQTHGLTRPQRSSLMSLAWLLAKQGVLTRVGQRGREILYSASPLARAMPPRAAQINARTIVRPPNDPARLRHYQQLPRVGASVPAPDPEPVAAAPDPADVWLPAGAPVPVERGGYVLPSYALFCQAMRGYPG